MVRSNCVPILMLQAHRWRFGATVSSPKSGTAENPNYFVSIHDLPRVDETITDIVDQPWTISTLIEKEDERAREGSKARSLRELYRRDGG